MCRWYCCWLTFCTFLFLAVGLKQLCGNNWLVSLDVALLIQGIHMAESREQIQEQGMTLSVDSIPKGVTGSDDDSPDFRQNCQLSNDARKQLHILQTSNHPQY